MQNGFQMYLDEHNGELGGAKVNADRRGRPGQAGHRRHQGQQADPVRQGAHAGRRRAGDDGLCAGAGRDPREDALHRLDRDRRRSRPARLREISLHGAADLRAVAAGASARAMGLRAGLQADRLIAADYAFGHETAGGFQKAFEDCGGKIVQKIWPPIGTKDFGPYIPTHQERHRRHLRADGRADVAAIPQAAPRLRLQEADPRRRHQLRRIHPAVDGRRA